MRIALIGQKGIPVAHGGGVEKHVENLAVRLAELGQEVLVYTRHNYTDKSLHEYRGVRLINLPSIKTKNLDAISHTFLACLDLAFRKVDVIHFHSIGPSSLIWLVKLLNPRTPIIATFHSQCYYNEKWGWLAKLYLKFGEYTACQQADVLLTVSQALTEYVSNKYPRSNCYYLPNGVNLIKPLPAKEITKRWGLVPNNYILTVSRLVPNKGLEILIKAYQQITTDKKIVITGDGPLQAELQELAGGHPNIIFTGNQIGQTLNELLSNAYLFIQPSESEGLSLSLLEAMSFKNACLVSDIPANLEVVANPNFSFQNRDVNDLTKKLTLLLNNSAEVEVNKDQLFKKVAQDYNWENIVSDILKIYSETRALKARKRKTDYSPVKIGA